MSLIMPGESLDNRDHRFAVPGNFLVLTGKGYAVLGKLEAVLGGRIRQLPEGVNKLTTALSIIVNRSSVVIGWLLMLCRARVEYDVGCRRSQPAAGHGDARRAARKGGEERMAAGYFHTPY